jgi:hypothetical protein
MNLELSSMRGLVTVKQYSLVQRQHGFAFARNFHFAFMTTVLMSSFGFSSSVFVSVFHALPCLRSRPSSILTCSC